MVDKLNTTPIGQERETLTFKALLYLTVAVHAQVCRLLCVVYVSPIVRLGKINEYRALRAIYCDSNSTYPELLHYPPYIIEGSKILQF